MSIKSDIQLLDPTALISLYVLDATSLSGSLMRFHTGINELGNDVVWQGNTYTRFPIEITGFEKSSKGAIPRPKAKIANITGLVGALVHGLNDLIGATVTRKRTFLKYLDAVNFAAGNPSADPNVGFPDDVYYIDRKSAENKLVIEFELTSAWDVQGVQLPHRQVISNICPWKYRSAECGFAGGAIADASDVATTTLALDACGKRISSCKMRFGATAELPFGGFPGAGIL
jgi:lambda family phage minor tail protein L